MAKEKDYGEGWGVHLVGELQALGVNMISGIRGQESETLTGSPKEMKVLC